MADASLQAHAFTVQNGQRRADVSQRLLQGTRFLHRDPAGVQIATARLALGLFLVKTHFPLLLGHSQFLPLFAQLALAHLQFAVEAKPVFDEHGMVPRHFLGAALEPVFARQLYFTPNYVYFSPSNDVCRISIHVQLG